MSKASLAVVLNAGATPLDLEAAADADMEDAEMSPYADSEMSCGTPWSPMTPAIMAARSPSKKKSMTASAFGASCDVLGAAGAGGLVLPSGRILEEASGAPAAMSPTTAAMSPGGIIRKNAASLGIPLNLRAAPGEVFNPVPVRTSAGKVLAPSPTARLNNRPGDAANAGGEASLSAVSFGPKHPEEQRPSGAAPSSDAGGCVRAMATPLTRGRRAAAGC